MIDYSVETVTENLIDDPILHVDIFHTQNPRVSHNALRQK